MTRACHCAVRGSYVETKKSDRIDQQRRVTSPLEGRTILVLRTVVLMKLKTMDRILVEILETAVIWRGKGMAEAGAEVEVVVGVVSKVDLEIVILVRLAPGFGTSGDGTTTKTQTVITSDLFVFMN